MRVSTPPRGRIEVTHAVQSRHQLIQLGRVDGQRCLLLDGELQYVEGADAEAYHQALGPALLVHLPAHPGPTGAILGGGDGILAAHLLRARPDFRLTVFELDPAMLQLFRTHPDALAVNGGSLDWVERLVVGDALRTLHGRYDAVFMDFPDLTAQTAYLYGDLAFARAHGALHPWGALSAHCGGPREPVALGRYFEVIGERLVPGYRGGMGRITHARPQR